MSGLPQSTTLARLARQLAGCDPASAARVVAALPAGQQQALLHAHGLLLSGQAYGAAARALSAEELAAYCEGELSADDARRVEQICWQSPDQLAELLSIAGALECAEEAAVSPALEARLLAFVTQERPDCEGAIAPRYRLEPRTQPQVAEAPLLPPPVLQRGLKVNGHAVAAMDWHTEHKSDARRWWPVAAAALLAASVTGVAGWLATTRSDPRPVPEVAHQPTIAPATVETDDNPDEADDAAAPERLPRERPEIPLPRGQQPARSLVDGGKRLRLTAPESIEPEDPLAARPVEEPWTERGALELSIASSQGLMLSDVGLRGKWSVAGRQHDLAQPLRMLSLAESWTRVELPGVGTLIFEGDAEAALTMQADGTVEVRMGYGRLGVENLRAGAKLRLVTGEAACVARGVEERSTLAMVSDAAGPGLLVPHGAVAVDHLEIREGQVVRWQGGMPHEAGSLTPSEQGSLSAPAPPLMDASDLAWLAPPTEFAIEQWNANYGALAARLVKADDVAVELIKLADELREPEQAALIARWSVAANPSERGNRVWSMLNDRRAAVRASAMWCLLESPPGDARASELALMIEDRLGAVVAERIERWLAAAWQPGPLAVGQAAEIVEHLQHSKLAVRQVAVSLLELHTRGLLQPAGLRLPAYDATARPAQRAAGYAEWRAVMAQLYSPKGKIPTRAGALQPGATQPQRQRALLNGAGSGR